MKKILSLFLVLTMVIGMLPVASLTAFAAVEVRPEVKWGTSGNIQFTLDDSGVLSWNPVNGATSYDFNIYMHGSLFKSEEGNTSRSYNLVSELNKYKKDSGTVRIIVNPKGVEAGNGDRVDFMYSSPYPKLAAPSNLKWDVYGNADWDDVANADGYTLYLYQPSSGAYNHYDLVDSYFNCTNYPDVATRISDGWYYAVRATSTGLYRPSEYHESYRRGHVVGSGLQAGNVSSNGVTFTITDTGMLTWTAVAGATSYDLNMWMTDGLFRSVTGLTTCEYALQAELNKAKKDSGTVKIALNPVGNNVSNKGATVYILYSSPYGKLEAPKHLTWNGNIGTWGFVPGAESYTVYLYQASGSGYNHWTTTETQFDFSTVANPDEDWFFTVKATSSTARDSVFAESPRKSAYESTNFYTIGAYVYSATLGEFDIGGQVKLTTDLGTDGWSVSGYTLNAFEGKSVTVEATPTPGYVFVEWRQGTQGATISKDATYSFTCTDHKFLYAIFREKSANEIAEVVANIADEHIPRPGLEVNHFMPTIADGESYSRIWNGSEWRDENGVLISPNIGHYYDIGYEFEAGKSYTTDYFYFDAADGYTFAEDVKVYLEGPDPSMWEYKITGFNDSRTIVYVQFTFHIPGNRDYPDINKVSMVYYGTHAEGAKKPDPARLIYNNCAITREEWNTGTWGSSCNWGTYAKDDSGDPCFLAGNTYVHMIEMTALPGYHFSEDLIAQKGRQKEEEYGVVSLSDDRTVATIRYTYPIGAIEYLNSVRIEPKPGNENFYLIRQGNNTSGGIPFTTVYHNNDDPYEIHNNDKDKWYDVETGKELTNGVSFLDLELGKKYRLEFRIYIKDEYEETIRFHEDTQLVFYSYIPAKSDYVEVETFTSTGSTQMRVAITYTVQPTDGEGKTIHNPLICYSYNEFKYAMENKDIRYVVLGDVEDSLPRIPHDPQVNDNRTNAIMVRGKKDLNLLGNAVFTCPIVKNYNYKTYEQLLTLSDTANADLYIHGGGSLTFNGSNMYFFNSAIKVAGGNLCVDGATVRGSHGNHDGYCYGINALYGSVSIQGGATVIGGVYDGDGICALSLGDEGLNDSLSVSIFDGNFSVDRYVEDGNHDYGIWIMKDCGLRLYGAKTDGIKLPSSTQSHTYRMSNYVQDGCVMKLNGVEANPANYHTISNQTVEIYKEISKVDIHVNSPVSGESPVQYMEDVYMVPEGCTVQRITWFEDGASWDAVAYGNARFEAGKSYKIEIALSTDERVKFANPLQSATINYKTATVTSQGIGAQYGIILTVDLGTCPATVGEVKLTTTAPKEGSIPAAVTRGNSTYSVNDTQWWVSNTGEDGTWSVMGKNTKYAAEKYYKLSVDLKAANGYRFVTDENLDPDVFATVNGYTAKVSRVYEQAADEFIQVHYNFGVCNKTTIESVIIENVTAPVVGEYPSYTCAYVGTGYGYYTDMDNGTYKQNGMVWYDVTGGGNIIVWNNDTFLAGHTYKLEVTARVQDGFSFANSVFATVNGDGNVTAKVTNGIWCTVTYTFTCQPKTFTSIAVTGLDRPVDGAHPDFSAITDSEYYTVEEIVWYDYENGMEEMTSTDTFAVGNRYYLMLTVVPTKTGSANNAKFVSGKTTAKLNGITVKKVVGDSWQEVSATSKAVTIFYTFENTPYADGPFCVRGEVISYDGTVDGTEIQLVPYGETTPAYTMTLTSGSAYTFPQVEAGIYMIYFKKAGYITREFIISVYNDVTQDAVMMKDYSANKGDLDLDGDVDEDDAVYLLQYVLMPEFFPVSQAVDFDSNGIEDEDDAVYLLQHVLMPEFFPL